jgi:hypothetical protein
MFEVKLNLGDQSFLARLGRAKDFLFRRGKRVEKQLKDGNDVGGRERRAHYKNDAEESLAMALGKGDVKNIHGDQISSGIDDALNNL